MRAGLTIWDRQHAGKRTRPTDMGAAADIDGDGQIEVWEREAELTPIYAEAGMAELTRLGLASHFIDPKGAGLQADYPARHREAVALAQDRSWTAYLACHLNAGGGNYGLVGYVPGSTRGRALAEAIAAELQASVHVISRCRVEALAGNWARGLPTIGGAMSTSAPWLAGVLLEPLFVDAPEHQSYIHQGGLTEVGRAIARGVRRWAGA